MSDPKCNDCIFKKTHANDLPCCDCFQGKHYRYDETEDLKQTLEDTESNLKEAEEKIKALEATGRQLFEDRKALTLLLESMMGAK